MSSSHRQRDLRALRDRWTRAAEAFVGDDPGRSVSISAAGLHVAVADRTVRPGASVLKLFIVVAVHMGAAAGRLDLNRALALDELPSSTLPSFLDALDRGHRFNLGELAGLSLATGDNRVTGGLLGIVDMEFINETTAALGFSDTQLRVGFDDDVLNEKGWVNVTSTADCVSVLGRIMTDPVLAPLRPVLRTTMFINRITARITAMLPTDLVVSHKTGTIDGVANDVGVIHAPSGDLTVCFLTEGQADRPATAIDIATCARSAYDAWEMP